MDLRSVLNSSDAGARDQERDRGRASSAVPPTPQQQPPRQLPQYQQSPAAYPYRDYGHDAPQPQPHPSPGQPGRPPHAEYPPSAAHHQPGPYQTPASPYASRPAPPPLQPSSSYHDVRSPSGPVPAPSPSAYRPTATPTSTTTPVGAPGAYPFPPQEMTSPSIRHQYPPAPHHAPQPPQRQDSYPHSSSNVFAQQPPAAPVPQPSPVVTPGGGPHPYPAQRSQSTQSTPTPTSAHSQHQYGPPYARGSPVAPSQPLPNEYNRHPSQPSTPLAPHLSAPQRPPSAHGAYAPQSHQQLPSSPYQHRVSSLSGTQGPQTQTPPPPPPPRLPSQPHVQPLHTPAAQRAPSHPPVEDRQRPPITHDRDGSLSVSPKTRVASLAEGTDRDHKPLAAVDVMAIDSDRTTTPAKRKLGDRDLSPREMEHKEMRRPPGELNGENAHRRSYTNPPKTESPVAPTRKRRVPRPEPPVWARTLKNMGTKMPKTVNFVLQKRPHGGHLNGVKHEGPSKSRHEAPEKSKSRASQPPAPAPEPGPQDFLGPWEASITGVRPYEEVSRMIADFLFIHVVNSEDMQEVRSRGIKFEVEAKLGTLIDKDTNRRVERGIESEAVLQDTGRTAFKSSMTEVHHKAFNDFLNQVVIQTDPRSGNGRVQVQYAHRREIDKFIDLPTELHARLPGCMRSRLGTRARNVRVRVTYDQKTKEVLATIIKARVADIDIHLPSCPMDCRLSVNLEMDWEDPVSELEQLAASQTERQPDRNKDRLSYTHGPYQIDLTQVTQQIPGPANSSRIEKEHELEIELNPIILVDQGRRALDGGAHRYQELVEGLVDNVRVLSRKAREFS